MIVTVKEHPKTLLWGNDDNKPVAITIPNRDKHPGFEPKPHNIAGECTKHYTNWIPYLSLWMKESYQILDLFQESNMLNITINRKGKSKKLQYSIKTTIITKERSY